MCAAICCTVCVVVFRGTNFIEPGLNPPKAFILLFFEFSKSPFSSLCIVFSSFVNDLLKLKYHFGYIYHLQVKKI